MYQNCLYAATGNLVCNNSEQVGDVQEHFYARKRNAACPPGKRCAKMEKFEEEDADVQEHFYARKVNAACPPGKRCAKMEKFSS